MWKNVAAEPGPGPNEPRAYHVIQVLAYLAMPPADLFVNGPLEITKIAATSTPQKNGTLWLKDRLLIVAEPRCLKAPRRAAT